MAKRSVAGDIRKILRKSRPKPADHLKPGFTTANVVRAHADVVQQAKKRKKRKSKKRSK